MIVGAFLVFWLASVGWYKLRRIDQRYGIALGPPEPALSDLASAGVTGRS